MPLLRSFNNRNLAFPFYFFFCLFANKFHVCVCAFFLFLRFLSYYVANEPGSSYYRTVANEIVARPIRTSKHRSRSDTRGHVQPRPAFLKPSVTLHGTCGSPAFTNRIAQKSSFILHLVSQNDGPRSKLRATMGSDQSYGWPRANHEPVGNPAPWYFVSDERTNGYAYTQIEAMYHVTFTWLRDWTWRRVSGCSSSLADGKIYWNIFIFFIFIFVVTFWLQSITPPKNYVPCLLLSLHGESDRGLNPIRMPMNESRSKKHLLSGYHPGEKRLVTGLWTHVCHYTEETYWACAGRVPQPGRQRWRRAEGDYCNGILSCQYTLINGWQTS